MTNGFGGGSFTEIQECDVGDTDVNSFFVLLPSYESALVATFHYRCMQACG